MTKDKDLLIGGFGQPAQNVDATGRAIRPARKPVLTTQERKEAILQNKDAEFKIVPNPNASGRKPWFALDSYSEVKANEKTIEREAKKVGVDPDLVKAVIHLETTHGYYDRLKEIEDRKSLRPMNVNVEYWKDLGYSREDLKNTDKNIRAGFKLLKRIQDRIPNATPAKIGSIYHELGNRTVTDYGARIEKILEEKPWED